jgi:hypothetical protein
MGNAYSTNTDSQNPGVKTGNFYEIIDYIASHYILTMDFQSLKKLAQKEYCDKLVIITSDIIKDHFSERDITYLAQRVKQGVEVNDMTKQNVIFVNEDQLKNLDTSNGVIDKKRKCIGIAKFYIKIAHIFSAIVMTINPMYAYKSNGVTENVSLMDKKKIPPNTPRKISKLNICDNRLRALERVKADATGANNANNATGATVATGANNANNVILSPKICDMNLDATKSLIDEPGIPELLKLYFDKYDYSTGEFTGMTEQTQVQYSKDVRTFFTAFTGKAEMPPEIKKFSDIKLRNYKNLGFCNNSALKTISISKKDNLFIKYAENLKNMMNTASSNQQKLLSVINEIFTFVLDPDTKNKKIRINPRLTDDGLAKLVENTRKLIIDLYVTCEMDYVNGVKLYEAIVESKILETTKTQISSLNAQKNQLIGGMKHIVSNKPPLSVNNI